MKVIVGENAGFCYGVKRAVDGAREELKKGKEIYCLGDIVHNNDVIDDLKKHGMKFIDRIEEARGKTIIRAHGVSKEVYKKAKNMNIEIKDLTCPSVLKIHKIANEYASKGYYIILTGKVNHPEVIGIESHCGDNYSVITEKEELEALLNKIKNEPNVLLISQTTYSSKKFDEIADILKKEIKDNLVVNKTICPSTEFRQKETEEIAKQVDLMIIIGGKKSSNTKKLYDISCNYCKNVIYVENAKDFNIENYRNFEKIGIMAGASTPQEQIEKVKGCIK